MNGVLPIVALALSPFLAFAVQPLANMSAQAAPASEFRFLTPPLASGRVAVFEQADGLVVVDGGGTADEARRTVSMIQSMTSKPVKTVVVAHAPNVHASGVAEIRRVWPGARIVATEGTSMPRSTRG